MNDQQILNADLGSLGQEDLETLLGAAVTALRRTNAAIEETRNGLNRLKERKEKFKDRVKEVRRALKAADRAL